MFSEKRYKKPSSKKVSKKYIEPRRYSYIQILSLYGFHIFFDHLQR